VGQAAPMAETGTQVFVVDHGTEIQSHVEASRPVMKRTGRFQSHRHTNHHPD
jgi:hypothetical protein